VSVAAVLAISVGLAGCAGSGNFQIFQSSCSSNNNCPPDPEFLYATSPNQILAFKINSSTGALGTPLAMPGPNQSIGMTATGFGNLYVSDFLNDSVDGFSINPSTGGLTAIAGSPFSLGGTPPGAGGLSGFVSGGSYLYVTDLNEGKVAGFADNPINGMLTPVPGSPFAAGNTPVQAVQTVSLINAGADKSFLYVSNLNDSAGGISAFTIDSNSGALTPIAGSPFPTGATGSFPGPSAMVVGDNTVGILYVALAGTANVNNKIAGFVIDANTGVLTAVAGSPFATGADPLYIALVPITNVGFREFLYTANVGDNTISAFTADGNTGVLTPVSGSPYAGGTSLSGLAVTPDGRFLYAADPQAKTIRAYVVDGTTGALSPIPGSPFTAGSSPTLLTVAVCHC